MMPKIFTNSGFSVMTHVLPAVLTTILIVGASNSYVDKRIKKTIQECIQTDFSSTLTKIQCDIEDIKLILEIVNRDNIEYKKAVEITKARKQ